jgi:two-component system, cell cycle response regulator CpdR
MAANILVVEDDLLNRNLICKVLRKEGHQVVEACDGAIALEILQVLPFDLVITDFMMPKLNGIKLVEHLHSLQPRMPIIFITGFLSVLSGKTILDDVAEVLAKPFGPDAPINRAPSARFNAALSPLVSVACHRPCDQADILEFVKAGVLVRFHA